MDTIVVIVMVALFVVLMAFVFSTAMLTPIIGKKNLLFVVSIGLVVGIIGGAFLIAPIIDDIPAIATSFYISTSNDVETLNVDVSTNMNINQFIEKTKNMDGVKSVGVSGVTLKTTPFSDSWKSTLPKRIPSAVKGVKSVEIPSNDVIEVQIQDMSNTPEIIKKLDDWLSLVSGIEIRYSMAHATVQVESSKVYVISDELSKDAVVKEIKGPTQDKINYVKSVTPNKFNVVILCGFIGVVTGLAGVFVDSILALTGELKGRFKKNKES